MLCGPLALSTSANDVWLMRERLFDSTDATSLKVTALPSKTGRNPARMVHSVLDEQAGDFAKTQDRNV